jgi:hypothetical protein
MSERSGALWKNKSGAGTKYLNGNHNEVSVIAFLNGKNTDFEGKVWQWNVFRSKPREDPTPLVQVGGLDEGGGGLTGVIGGKTVTVTKNDKGDNPKRPDFVIVDEQSAEPAEDPPDSAW